MTATNNNSAKIADTKTKNEMAAKIFSGKENLLTRLRTRLIKTTVIAEAKEFSDIHTTAG